MCSPLRLFADVLRRNEISLVRMGHVLEAEMD